MSDLRVGLVAEGKTDLIIIEAALKSIFDNRTFTLTLLQPETSDSFGGCGPLGGGWSGVYKWCQQLVSMQEPVAGNSSLSGFDLILLHVDADVAGKDYPSANINNGLDDLPCQRPCPPAAASVDILRKVITRWLDLPTGELPPTRWVFCNPSMCSEAWLVAALYRDSETGVMVEIECNQNLEKWLSQRPINEGRLIHNGKKRPAAYRDVAPKLTSAWADVCNCCSQARRFAEEVRTALV